MTTVLDAWAAVALMQDEPSAPQVEKAIEGGALMSDINLGEALYTLIRRRGEEAAASAIRKFRSTVVGEAPDWSLTRRAAVIKAMGGLSYADSFAVATAQRHSASLLTGDPEIVALHGIVDVVDLREEP